MSEASNVIARWLWRFYPMVFLTWALGGLMHWALSILEDEEERQCMLESPAYCAWYASWLAFIEHRLNALITLKAMRRLKRSYHAQLLAPRASIRGVTTFEQAYARFMRLAGRYHDVDRLVRLRTVKLERLFERCDLELESVHHPVSTTTIYHIHATIFSLRPTTIFDASRAVDDFHLVPRIRAPPWHPRNLRKIKAEPASHVSPARMPPRA